MKSRFFRRFGSCSAIERTGYNTNEKLDMNQIINAVLLKPDTVMSKISKISGKEKKIRVTKIYSRREKSRYFQRFRREFVKEKRKKRN